MASYVVLFRDVLPVCSVQLSKQGNCENQRNILGEVDLRARGNVKRVLSAFLQIVAHVPGRNVKQGSSKMIFQDHAYVFVFSRLATIRFWRKM
jgi:hypothetical protein